MLTVRPATSADLDALMDLAVLSGSGFTSLPEDRDVLAERLALAEQSFAGTVAPAEAWYTVMLEDSADGSVHGVAAVRAAVGLGRPHFSFRVMTLAQYSPATRTRFDHQALVLVNECAGWSEVGSLYVRPALRGSGAGVLLARARYMLIASDPLRFSLTVMAELRGWFDEAGHSPFWDGVASKFYRLPFAEADRMVTASDGQFILDLAPRHPIYVELIGQAAADAIGRVHRHGQAAHALLEREGFTRSGLIDIFDGGPTMVAPRDEIRTIRSAQRLRVAIDTGTTGSPSLLSSGAITRFRAVCAACYCDDEVATIAPETAAALGVSIGEKILVEVA